MSGGRYFAGGVRGWLDNGGPDMRGGGGPDGRTGAQVAALTDRTTRTHQTRGRIRGAEIPGVEPVSPMVRPRRAGGAAAGWACGRWSPLTPYLSMAIAISPVSEALGVVTRRICKALTLGSGDVNEAV